jgi:hypothetical protein
MKRLMYGTPNYILNKGKQLEERNLKPIKFQGIEHVEDLKELVWFYSNVNTVFVENNKFHCSYIKARSIDDFYLLNKYYFKDKYSFKDCFIVLSGYYSHYCPTIKRHTFSAIRIFNKDKKIFMNRLDQNIVKMENKLKEIV